MSFDEDRAASALAAPAQQSAMGADERGLSWKDTEGTSRPAYRLHTPPLRMPIRRVNPFVVALLWFLSAVLLFAAGMSVVQSRSRAAAEYVKQIEREAEIKAQAQREQQQREAAEREAKRVALLDEQETARLQAIAERQRADEAAKRDAVNEAERKAKAWLKFYRKPSVCNDATTLECANAYIRAQRAFELKYAKGEL
jgi:flagellar biosynthesis GTPase FlhF